MCSICHWQSSKVHMVLCKSKEVDSAIADATLMQQNDEWSLEVKGRLDFVNNLCAEDAIYRGDCKSRFQSDKKIWIRYWDLISPTINEAEETFEEIVEYLCQNDGEQITISKLSDSKKEKVSFCIMF